MNRAASVLTISFLLLIAFLTPGSAQDPIDLGGIKFEPAKKTRRNWALLIGINYTERLQDEGFANIVANQKLIPPLKNAANDAKAIRDVLVNYYEGYTDETVIVLTDDKKGDAADRPSLNRIREEITQLHQKIGKDDSFLFFFAGHGYKQPLDRASGSDLVELLPYDVQPLRDTGRPVSTSTIGVPNELFALIGEVPCEHKLMVLDCCYSGEIFNARLAAPFQPASKQSRSDELLQYKSTFQAMASCRSDQVSKDGRGNNSQFTTALLDGLKHLPGLASDRRVWANRLLAYMSHRVESDQQPDCRNFNKFEGEFCFYPKGPSSFKEFNLDPSDKTQLRAMVVSLQGNWWFEEMPWFIPGIRQRVLTQHELTTPIKRSSDYVDMIDIKKLLAATETIIADMHKVEDKLEHQRLEHAARLLRTKDAKELVATLIEIEQELLACLPDNQPTVADPAASEPKEKISEGTGDEGKIQKSEEGAIELRAEDLHFLAVVQHALKKEEAARTYLDALEKYHGDSTKDSTANRILHALCMADHGNFLYANNQPEDAAKRFIEARQQVGAMPVEGLNSGGANDEIDSYALINRREDATAFFKIYMYCREADAWKSINRWNQANDALDEALNMAESSAPGHYLHAYVHYRRGWSKMSQWKIQEAKTHFKDSNKTLNAQFEREFAARSRSSSPSTVVNSVPEETEKRPVGDVRPTLSDPNNFPTKDADVTGQDFSEIVIREDDDFKLTRAFKLSTDFASKIAYLHNLHGLAMAMRFEGDSELAARHYRSLSAAVEDTLAQFHLEMTDADLENQLVERFINTQTRLGDCNLFGNPSFCDLQECIDDYRRALGRVHRLPAENRDETRAVLLYKMALAFSLESPIRDTELALEMCETADALYEPLRENATGNLEAFGELTTAIVELLGSEDKRVKTLSGEPKIRDASTALRERILSYREMIDRLPHRDQLELGLFSSRVLLSHGGERSRFVLMADTDLLLNFCKMALAPPQFDNQSVNAECRAYLRPYYDSIWRAEILHPHRSVQKLMEIQFEATTGTRYKKPVGEIPVLATFTVDDEYFLLADVPSGERYCIPMSDIYETSEIHRVGYLATEPLLPLPQSVKKSLVEWRTSRIAWEPESRVEARWDDFHVNSSRVSNFRVTYDGITEESPTRQFPFSLPDGFVVSEQSDSLIASSVK